MCHTWLLPCGQVGELSPAGPRTETAPGVVRVQEGAAWGERAPALRSWVGRGGGVLGTGGGIAREAGRTREPGGQKGGLARAALAGQEGWRAEELRQGAGQAIPRLADGSPRPRSALSTYPSPRSAKQGPRGSQVLGSRTAGPPSALPCHPGPLTLSIQPHCGAAPWG